MKLKDYAIPQYGLADGADPADLAQYSLKNFDLEAYQRAQEPPANPVPMVAPPANPIQTVPSQLAVAPSDVQFGLHFNLQQPLYIPPSPSQSWKLPRWVILTVGLFFGSAAVLTFACCIVLLRDPKPAPTAQLAAPTPPVASAAAAQAQPRTSSPTSQASPDVRRAPSAHAQATTTRREPAPARHDASALPHRTVVSRNPSVVRRQSYGTRRVASKSTSPAEAAQEPETASRRPPKDALDQLLSESAL